MNIDKRLRDWPKWPVFGQKEVKAVKNVVKSNQLYAATQVKEFESEFAEYQNCKFAVGVGNATQGLHLALASANIGRGDEVIVTACSWISSASAILMQNAVPVFVDIESESLGLCPIDVEKKINNNTKAIILVHILGYPAKVELIAKIAKKYNLILIEDASHAPGAEVNGKKIGTFGDLGVFSLHQRKAISTGDGGIICTDNFDLASKLSRLRSFGDSDLSYNYRMTEFAATLGRIGLTNLDKQNAERIWAAEYLQKKLSGLAWVKVRMPQVNEKSVYHAVALELKIEDDKSVKILEELVSCGVPMRKLFSPLNRHPHFSSARRPARGYPWLDSDYKGVMKGVSYENLDLPITYKFCYGKILELYTHPGITKKHLDAFAKKLVSVYSNY